MSGYIGTQPVPQATQTRDVFTATANQTSFATSGYTPGYLDVYLNGVKLIDGADFTASNGSDVVLATGATLNDTLEVLSYSTFEVNSQNFTGNTVIDNVDINGGTIDGTVIGGNSPAAVTGTAGSFSNLSVNGNPLPTAGSLSNRNKIINGAMVIDQRNAGAAVSVPDGTGTYIVDRFFVFENTAASLAAQQGPGPNAGFKNMTASVVTAGSATAAQLAQMQHRIEGQNVADLLFGTADAKTVTLSFWVQASLTGTYCVSLRNGAFARSYVAEYTVSAADTWEYKTITVPGDTAGTWLTTNGIGITLTWDLGSGTDFNGTNNAWSAANSTRTTNQVNFINTAAGNFRLSGVQLEVGDTATPFEHRSYGQELALCQRYYMRWQPKVNSGSTSYPAVGFGYATGTGNANYGISTPSAMRATPTVSFSGTINAAHGNIGATLSSVNTIYEASNNGFWINASFTTSPYTTGHGGILYVMNSTANYFEASAEL